MTARMLVTNIGALYTMADGAGRDGRDAASLRPVSGGEVEIEDGIVVYAGPVRAGGSPAGRSFNPYPAPPTVASHEGSNVTVDAGGALVTPGLVDPHTHAVYGGNRAFELPLKMAGVPYLEILKRGGGILATVRATRDASDEELVEAATLRLLAMLRQGTTTVEVKSGYGLSVEHELRLLRLIKQLGATLPLTLVPTFMGAHAVPEEFRSNPSGYVDLVVDEMMPAVAGQGIARFVDVFCEPAVFDVAASRRILEAGRKNGLRPKIHADEIEVPAGATTGAELASEVGAISADHLRETGGAGLAALSRAGTVPVVLPATSFCLRDHRYAPARRMIDEFDLPVALATDCNPGTSPTESLPLVMALAALELKMTPEEILAAVTVHAARAIGVEAEAGALALGMEGDLVIWQAYDLAMLCYRFGANQAAMVVKRGSIVARSEEGRPPVASQGVC